MPPPGGFVGVNRCAASGDSRDASIFYTVYGTDEERADTGAALKSATGMLRMNTHRPVLRAGRIAGQFAKPRSKPTELVGGVEVPVYRWQLPDDSQPALHLVEEACAGRLNAITFTSATEMQIVLGVKDGQAGAVETLTIDYAGCWQTR